MNGRSEQRDLFDGDAQDMLTCQVCGFAAPLDSSQPGQSANCWPPDLTACDADTFECLGACEGCVFCFRCHEMIDAKTGASHPGCDECDCLV